ncbi:hypothetical protein ASPVEDRAFT_53834 [Aspergillus versicolor CBS 583.65]|uniref:Uncharacterized protein n=1 Tax=Aspergillus versicolor CBS 583.65 TaxID=1036611 RepID=A0A1L9PPI0_ASPVE|nr:uncharacterized protein ASPVEDRAFT_53834 [Aspergillus versicolor CBS 583.65]OJJ03411.1 hypothetical protein ASPVEDRAFT_53834 [Aspergillus versicolor CBS 583.65]
MYRQLRQRPLTIVGSEGNYLITKEGLKIFDATSGAVVSCLGHSDERVHDAIMKQLKRVPYCYSLFFTNDAAEKLATMLSQSTGGKMSRAFIVSSGTEAMEAAIKMALQYFRELPTPQPQRTKLIARKLSYHGNTLGSLALGHHQGRRAPYESILSSNITHVSQYHPYRDMLPSESPKAYVARLAQELEDEFQRQGQDTICAVALETMAGSTLGCVPPLPGYLKAMKEVCERHGALLILDEVMCGMGRTGTLHAWEQEGIVPDLQAVAKGLGAGYCPIGALLINEHVVNTLTKGTGAFVHSQTYQGHPVACAAACKVQEIIQSDSLLANVRKMGEYLGQQLKARLSDHPHVGDIRGRGLWWAVEFVQNKETKEPFPPSKGLAFALHATGLKSEHRISLMPGNAGVDGVKGDHIIISPPYNVTKSDVDFIVEKTADVIQEVLG